MTPLKFARRARAYFACVPEHKVCANLSTVIEGGPDAAYESHLHAQGWDWLSCGTTACLKGVLITMPEVHEQAGNDNYADLSTSLHRLLGLTNERAWQMLFEERCAGEQGTDKEVALRRLDRYIAELEATERA